MNRLPMFKALIVIPLILISTVSIAATIPVVGVEPQFSYRIWYVLVAAPENLSLPMVEPIQELISHETAVLDRCSSEEQFAEFLKSGQSRAFRNRMNSLTRYELAMMLERIFTDKRMIRKAKLHPGYSANTRKLLLEFKPEYLDINDSLGAKLTEIWNLNKTTNEG